MASLLRILKTFHLLILLMFPAAYGVKIQFYKHSNFTGLYLESNSTAECNTITFDRNPRLASVKTDTCFIIYTSRYCKGIWTTKILPGNHIFSAWSGPIASFHICNEEEGGNQLNVDITKPYFYVTTAPEVLQSFKNICSCVNVPEFVQNMSKWSINNHHNDMMLYYEPDCSDEIWYSKFLPAGHSTVSTDMQRLMKKDGLTNTTYKIQSFGPNPKSAYFQISCNSSHVPTQMQKTYGSTTESAKVVGIDLNTSLPGGTTSWKYIATTGVATDNSDSTTERLTPVDTDDLTKRFQRLTNQFLELQKQHKDDFNKIKIKITQLQRTYQNFTTKIMSDLHELLN